MNVFIVNDYGIWKDTIIMNIKSFIFLLLMQTHARYIPWTWKVPQFDIDPCIDVLALLVMSYTCALCVLGNAMRLGYWNILARKAAIRMYADQNHKTRDVMLRLSIVPIDGMHSHEICLDVIRVAWEVYFLDWDKMSLRCQFRDTSSVVYLWIRGCFGL